MSRGAIIVIPACISFLARARMVIRRWRPPTAILSISPTELRSWGVGAPGSEEPSIPAPCRKPRHSGSGPSDPVVVRLTELEFGSAGGSPTSGTGAVDGVLAALTGGDVVLCTGGTTVRPRRIVALLASSSNAAWRAYPPILSSSPSLRMTLMPVLRGLPLWSTALAALIFSSQ